MPLLMFVYSCSIENDLREGESQWKVFLRSELLDGRWYVLTFTCPKVSEGGREMLLKEFGKIRA